MTRIVVASSLRRRVSNSVRRYASSLREKISNSARRYVSFTLRLTLFTLGLTRSYLRFTLRLTLL